jgi:tRNA 2-thiocytidine biosynthesis protein TtcA
MLQSWQKQQPGRLENIFNALARVVPSHLMDRSLFDFQGLKATGIPDANGDVAFDAQESCEGPAGGGSATVSWVKFDQD